MSSEVGVHHPPHFPSPDTPVMAFAVVLLGVSAVTSTWCAFQSTLWSGRRTFAIAEGVQHSTRATEAHLGAHYGTLLDVSMFMAWHDASRRSDPDGMAFYEQRFRPELQRAFDPWREAAARNPDGVPSSPFATPEYRSAERDRGDVLAEEARIALDDAAEYNRTAETYALLTVLFSMAMILAGLAEKLRDRPGRRIVFAIATILLTSSVIVVLMLPKTWFE